METNTYMLPLEMTHTLSLKVGKKKELHINPDFLVGNIFMVKIIS